jgi:hypothetical protein
MNKNRDRAAVPCAINKIPPCVWWLLDQLGTDKNQRGMHLLAYILAHWPVTTCYVLAVARDRNHRPLFFLLLEVPSEKIRLGEPV